MKKLDLNKFVNVTIEKFYEALNPILMDDHYRVLMGFYGNKRSNGTAWFDSIFDIEVVDTYWEALPVFAQYTEDGITYYFVNYDNLNTITNIVDTIKALESFIVDDTVNDDIATTAYDYKIEHKDYTDSFTNIDELYNAMLPVFGDYASEYDVEAIVTEMSYWNDGRLWIKPEYDSLDEDFDQFEYNLLLMRHAIIKVVKA